MTARYVVAFNGMTPKSIAWLVVGMPSHGDNHGDVVATCPSEHEAHRTCAALNATQPNDPKEGQ